MNTRRWLSVAAVTIASATHALAGVGSDALASNTVTSGTIKATAWPARGPAARSRCCQPAPGAIIRTGLNRSIECMNKAPLSCGKSP
jgi:hypothetical protein